MIDIIADSLSFSKLRMTTVQISNVDMLALMDGFNDRRLNYTSVFDPEKGWTVLVTSSQWTSVLDRWENVSGYAQSVSRIIRKAIIKSTPTHKTGDEWHIPTITNFDVEKAVEDAALHIQTNGLDRNNLLDMAFDTLQKVSAARCLIILGDMSFDAALWVYHAFEDNNHPNLMHAREHIQRPDRFTEDGMGWLNPKMHGHAEGWISFQNVAKFEEWRVAA